MGQCLLWLRIIILGCCLSACATQSIVPDLPTLIVIPSPTETEFSPVQSPTGTQTATPTATSFTGVIPTITTETPVQTTTASVTSPARLALRDSDFTEHIVQPGENLTLIANRYNLSVDELLSANDMSIWQTLFVGAILNIPLSNITATPSPTLDTTTRILNIQQELINFKPDAVPEQVNNLNYEDFLIMPDSVIDNIREIYATGQNLGRNPRAFTRIGDSTIEAPHFFYRFDEDDYHLGDYAYLQSTIEYYSGSFGHNSVAVIRGLHTWSVFDPMWSPANCEPGEHMLACEFRLHNPAILIIRLGTNDRGRPDTTRNNFIDIINYCIENGVIPILGTKADRFDGEDDSVNSIIRELAIEYDVPLWDFDRVASTLPYNGLIRDNVHLSFFYAHDWRLEQGFSTGHGLHNLTGLIVLDEVLEILNED